MFLNPTLNDLLNKYREKKLAHAYLIETNNIDLAITDLKLLIKNINCPNEFKLECKECNLCNLIAKDSLPSLKIIEPDGTSIKKNQIEDLQRTFATKPIYSRYNTYIIKNAEKLNTSSANSMLKFVEEPTDGIIGFFLTNNKDVMIDTIKSRCQILTINYEDNNEVTLGLSEEDYNNYLNNASNYIKKINSSKRIKNKEEVLNIYSERKDIEIFLKMIFNIYYENLLKKIGKSYNKKIVDSYEISTSLEELTEKLNILTTTLQNISYNVNLELMLDKFVIEMRGNHG